MDRESTNGSSSKDGKWTSRQRAIRRRQHPNEILRAETDYIRSQCFRLRMETARIQLENMCMRYALQHLICPGCRISPTNCSTSIVEEQYLIMQNIELRRELERVERIALSLIQRQPSISSDFSVHGFIPRDASTSEGVTSNSDVESVNFDEESGRCE